MNANVHNKTTSVNKRLNGGRGKRKKRDVLWDVREPKRESQEHPSNSKSPGERKNFSVCSRSVLVQATRLQLLSKFTLHIYTNTQLPHITEQSERERKRGGEREMQSEENSLTWCKRKLLSSHWPNECIHMQTGCFHDWNTFHFNIKIFWSCCFAFLCFNGKIQHSIKACCCAVVALTTNFDLYAKWLQSKYIYAQGKALSS